MAIINQLATVLVIFARIISTFQVQGRYRCRFLPLLPFVSPYFPNTKEFRFV